MKILVFYSGGKDSQATMIKAVNDYGCDKVKAVFCDTGWENELTYNHIQETTKSLNVELVVLKSQKYTGFIDLAKQKGRFPSSKARFCTEELKSKPAIDYILSLNDHSIIIQGIRRDESFARSKMEGQCNYFKYYFQPYGYAKNGKPKYHTYRKNDVYEYCKKYNCDVLRPIFNWTAKQTIDFIITNNQPVNPLYYQGFARVGCFPCIMSRHNEIKQIINLYPHIIELIRDKETEMGATFFAPKYIPLKHTSRVDKKGNFINSINEVEKYIKSKNKTELLYNEHSGFNCMSYYGLCE